ncbi:hypothetical protein LEFCBN_LEFCBN_12110, partial [Dysosmobacter welbionis]
VAEILHQEQLVFQIGALIAEMESVKNLCGEQIAPDESIEHRLGQPVPQQGIDDFLPDSVGVVDPGGQHRLRRLAAIRPQVQVRTGGGIRPGP